MPLTPEDVSTMDTLAPEIAAFVEENEAIINDVVIIYVAPPDDDGEHMLHMVHRGEELDRFIANLDDLTDEAEKKFASAVKSARDMSPNGTIITVITLVDKVAVCSVSTTGEVLH